MVNKGIDEFKKGRSLTMKAGTFYLLLKDSLKSIRRNTTTSISSIITVMLSLILLELFALSALNLKVGVASVYTQNEVQAILKENLSFSDQQNIYNIIDESKFSTNITLRNISTSTAVYFIRVSRPDDIAKMISKLKGVSGIDKITYSQIIPIRILSVINFIQIAGILLFVLLLFAVYFLVRHSMKLSIYNRINDITIMQYVGATDWFIRLPFIFEAIILGFMGAVASVIALYFSYSYIFKQIKIILGNTFIEFVNPSFIFPTMAFSFILIGILLTTIVNTLLIKKYLII
jgi:cell division transport system permease protein